MDSISIGIILIVIAWQDQHQTLTNSVMLEFVPKYNFYGAKRFEYELPAFYCGKGATKLISTKFQ